MVIRKADFSFDLGWLGFSFLAVVLGAMGSLAPSLGAVLTGMAFLAVVGFVAIAQRRGEGIGHSTQRVLLVALVCITAFWPTYIGLHLGSLPTIDARRLYWLALASLLLYALVGRKVVRERAFAFVARNKVLTLLMAAMFLLRALSAVRSPYLGQSLAAFVWECVSYAAPLACAVVLYSRRPAGVLLMKLLCVIAFICGLIALSEQVLHRNLLVDHLVRFANSPEVITEMTLSRFRDGRLRAQGPFEHPLLLAEFGTLALVFSLALLAWKNSVPKIYPWMGLFGASLCVALCFSRSAVVCSALGVGWLILQRIIRAKALDRTISRRVRFFVALTVTVVVLGGGALGAKTLLSGGSSSESQSSASRGLMLQRGLSALRTKPVTGFGMGTAGELAAMRGRGNILTLDNYLLYVGLESGAVYSLLLVVLLGWATLRSAYSSLMSERDAPFLAGTSAAIASMLVMRTVLAINYNLPLLFLMTGFALCRWSDDDEPSKP